MRRAEIGAMSSIRLRCLGSVCKGPEANSATRHGVWSVRGISVHLIVLVTQAGQTTMDGSMKSSDKRQTLIQSQIRAVLITG